MKHYPVNLHSAKGLAANEGRKRVILYNQLLAARASNNSRSHGAEFKSLLKDCLAGTNLYSTFTKSMDNDGRLLSLTNFFKFMFPHPHCCGCGGKLLGKSLVYCTKPCSMLHRTGYANPSQNPHVRAKKLDNHRRKYGVDYPYQRTSVVRKLRSSLRYRTPQEKAQHKRAMQATFLANYGVSWNTKDPDILAKVQKSAYTVKDGEYKGRKFQYQGWEDQVFRLLVDRYGSRYVYTQYDKGFPKHVMRQAGTQPDLYVASCDKFVEVKSPYTFFGQTGFLRNNKKKAKNLEATGNNCRWVILVRSKKLKKSVPVVLPKDWYTLTRKEIKGLLNRA
jgi:hypothetical protein